MGRAKEYSDRFVVNNPGLLTLQPTTNDGGKSIQMVARLQGWMPWTPEYTLYKASVRGVALALESWLFELYSAHVTRALDGAYVTNPYDPGVSGTVQQGDGGQQAPVSTVASTLTAGEPEQTTSSTDEGTCMEEVDDAEPTKGDAVVVEGELNA